MLEILALVYLCRKMGNLAEQKGQKRGVWQFYTVLAWFFGEIVGIVLAIVFFRSDEFIAFLPFAYGFAVGSYFILKSILSKKPDIVQTSFEFEEQSN
ncbi:MAG TPA: hypothetical protein VGQ09_17060 [Chitinophagaceae bacterium]|jgi:hypothetical protein|nr:hypothetical protein [Chitinophagaceae bacterium]